MKKILVTGAGGFAGSHLIQKLVDLSTYEISVISYSKSSFLESILDAGQIYYGDITDFDFVKDVFTQVKPDHTISLAALSSVQDSVEKARSILTSNNIIQLNLLEAARQIVPESRFIAVCSANEYGLVSKDDVPISEDTPLKPLNPYAVSKINQEYLSLQYHYSYGLDVVILRPFNHTGERQTTDFVIPSLARQIALIEKGDKNPEIMVGNTETIRDFTDVKDMVDAYILSLEKCESGEIYNIGSGIGVSIQEVIDMLIGLSKIDIRITKDDSRLRPSDVPVLISDYTKFNQATGWSPKIKLQDTLERVLEYWRGQ